MVAQRQRNDGQRLFRRVDKRRRDDATVLHFTSPLYRALQPRGMLPRLAGGANTVSTARGDQIRPGYKGVWV